MDVSEGELTQIKTHPYDRELTRIKNFLKGSSKGYTVTEISHAIDINRNSVAKYLDVLCISGAVELKVIGSAKIYTLTKRIPISSILSLSSDYLFVLDEDLVVTYVNEHVLNFERKTTEDVIGKSISSARFLLLSFPDIDSIIRECTQGKDTLKEIEVDRDGKTWSFRAKFVPSILENGKRGILIILDDITEIRQYQRDLEKTVEDRTNELTQTSTSLKQADHALVESEIHYRTIIETSPNGILVLDLEGIIQLGNIQAASMLGYATTAELAGKNFFDYVTPNDLENSRAHLKKTLEKGFSKYYECRLIAKDSTAFCAEVSVSTIPDHTGKPSGFVCVLSDVTEQRKADYLVRKSEEKHRSLVEGISHIIFTTDTRGRFSYVSPVIRQVLGYTPEELIGKYFYTLVPSEERHVLGEKLKEAQEGKISPNDFRMLDKSGGIHWGRIIAQPLIKGETVSGITGLIGDITDLKHSEAALLESEEKLKLAIEGSGVGLWDWRVQSGEMVINDRWAEILGYTVDELSPVTIDTWTSRTHPDDLQKFNELLQKHFSGENADFACESRMKHRDGHWVWVLDRGMVTERDKGGKPVRMTGTHLNISERKSAEEALRQVNRKLNLLSSLTRHDILNKVSVLLGFLDKAKGLARDADLRDYLDRMEASTNAIGKLVKFTRDFKDLGMNPPRWYTLKACMNEAKGWIDPAAVTLTVDVGEWEIYTDPQITRVFKNIFENAEIHGKHVTEMYVKCIKNERGLDVVIGDNGTGIPYEMKSEIFEPGMMRNRGFGLFLAKEILSITALTIVENGEPGKGARFEIQVPPECFREHQPSPGSKTKTAPGHEAAS
jgi:PAS domain S-box-containing protein